MKEEIQNILTKLPEEDRKKVLKLLDKSMESARNSAKAAIMARNLSHSLGESVRAETDQEDYLELYLNALKRAEKAERKLAEVSAVALRLLNSMSGIDEAVSEVRSIIDQ